MTEFIIQNITYPEKARQNSIQGTVYVSFIINTNGKVEKPEIVRGVSPELDAESIRVVEAMPDWKPGIQRGKPVSVRYTVPMNFVL